MPPYFIKHFDWRFISWNNILAQTTENLWHYKIFFSMLFEGWPWNIARFGSEVCFSRRAGEPPAQLHLMFPTITESILSILHLFPRINVHVASCQMHCTLSCYIWPCLSVLFCGGKGLFKDVIICWAFWTTIPSSFNDIFFFKYMSNH